MHGDPIPTLLQVSNLTVHFSKYEGWEKLQSPFLLQTQDIQPPAPPRNMKIATLHLLGISGDGSACFIPSWDGRLGDECESSHSFGVSVKNKPSHCITVIYSSWGSPQCRAPFQIVIHLEIHVATTPRTVVKSQKKKSC